MKRRYILVALASAQLVAAGAFAQPADLPIPAAVSDERPAGISVAKTKNGSVYVDSQGRTLYGMDMRAIVSRTANGAKYCQGPCLEEWEPLMAPPGSTPTIVPQQGFGGGGGQGQGGQGQGAQAQGQGGQAQGAGQASAQGAAQGQAQGAQAQAQGGGQNRTGSTTGAQAAQSDWGIIEGATGPQYVYKRWHVVYVRKGDKPGQTNFDGHDKYVWNTLKYVPPAPKLVAPTTVAAALKDGDYVLTDKQGAVLFTGNCTRDCRWVPLQAGAAGRGLGEWTVDRSGDTPQWVYRGKPVFVSQEEDPLQTPAAGTPLQP